MKLKRYCVTEFRSVANSGWVECSDVTTLIGINESGKSNLLLALWKLNPARDGKIDLLHDLPVAKLSELRTRTSETKFITAEFILGEKSASIISNKSNCEFTADDSVIISRFYNGEYSVEFGNKNITFQDREGDAEFLEDTECISKEDLKTIVLEEMPKFVYYSNYGNLSSKLYLPHVVTWLNGGLVTGVDIKADQVRTMRVLFDFVNLKPEEILELGKDPKVIAMQKYNYRGEPTEEEINQAKNEKEKRSILLQSAASKLTRCFKDWWNQGEYKFRFEADGDYFTIWVSDSVRTDEVALELRSTGMQWFLSFYLIFLVESQEQYRDAILLLDEAGLTLHPLAQKDLRKFFDNLAKNNQIINTTHSPFIVDTNNIDKCNVVYSDELGYTRASSNLRDGAGIVKDQSIYAVHAALGLSVSEIILQGCTPIIVEGVTDQYYLNAIKNYLISEKKLTSRREIVFIPSGGIRGVQGVVSLLTGKNNELPLVVLDSDKSGKDFKHKLESSLYAGDKEKLIEINDFVELNNAEIEDLIPFNLLEKGINKLFRDIEDQSFDDIYDSKLPIVPQIENFAKSGGIVLASDWKVKLAKMFIQTLQSNQAKTIAKSYKITWENLFKRFVAM